MTDKRWVAAAAYHPDVGFLITGGENGNGYLSSTEVSTDGTNFQVEIVLVGMWKCSGGPSGQIYVRQNQLTAFWGFYGSTRLIIAKSLLMQKKLMYNENY